MTLQKIIFSILLCIAITLSISAQNSDRVAYIEQQLLTLSDSTAKGLTQTVEVSVSGVNAPEFIRGLAIANDLNISIDPKLNTKITVNFANESVLNILMFLVKQYSFDIKFTGSIMYVTTYDEPAPPAIVKELEITYNTALQAISLDVRNDSLHKVVKKMVQLTDTNIITTPEVNSLPVSVFVQNMPLEMAIDKMAIANELAWDKLEDGTYLLRKKTVENTNKANDKNAPKGAGKYVELDPNFFLETSTDINGIGRITIKATETSIADLIKVVSQKLSIDHFIFTDPTGTTTLNIENLSYEEFLSYVLKGTDYDFSKEGPIYLIGKRTQEGFTNSKVIPLNYRTTDIVIDNIPSELRKSIEIRAFTELNSLIVSGPTIKVEELERFIVQIDKIVPVVMIEVLILDVTNSRSLSTGIEAGISTEHVETSGTVFPGVDVTISSGSLNNILSKITGTGVINLGKVAPEFYLKLSALETQGYLKVRSTPRLATLNSHEAVMSIGRTEYYIEETNNIIGSQNPQTVVTRSYKPVNADFSITINPVVSGDGQVTMSIGVEQSDFTTRISNTAPPGSSTRSFQSLIRVKSDEMIVLGGLEETRISDSGSGFPFLSRIPVLKWLFSSRNKQKNKSMLTILIKPTIIY